MSSSAPPSPWSPCTPPWSPCTSSLDFISVAAQQYINECMTLTYSRILPESCVKKPSGTSSCGMQTQEMHRQPVRSLGISCSCDPFSRTHCFLPVSDLGLVRSVLRSTLSGGWGISRSSRELKNSFRHTAMPLTRTTFVCSLFFLLFRLVSYLTLGLMVWSTCMCKISYHLSVRHYKCCLTTDSDGTRSTYSCTRFPRLAAVLVE